MAHSDERATRNMFDFSLQERQSIGLSLPMHASILRSQSEWSLEEVDTRPTRAQTAQLCRSNRFEAVESVKSVIILAMKEYNS